MKATYIKTRLPSIVNVSRIVTIHDYEFNESFRFDGESHDFWELVYVDSGRAEIFRDSERLTLSEGEIILHAPNEFHTIRALTSSLKFSVISFVCTSPAMQGLIQYRTYLDKGLKNHLSMIISEANRTFVIPKNDTELTVLVKREDPGIGGEQLIKTNLEQLLIFLIRKATCKGERGLFQSRISMEMYLVGEVKNIISEGLGRPFMVDEVCKVLGYSRSYLSRIFHKETGDTIAHFALLEKIKEAKRLIRDGMLNFAEISDKLAFDNPQYFSRVFKRITGITPTEYKRSHEQLR